MNISSAHVFARQIKSSGGPHPNWLYYGGEFNTNYMPSGFTNFADELVTFRGSTGTLNYQLNYANTNFLSQYMGTPHIIQLLGNDACSWELTNGELKNIQTGTIPQGADLFNNYHGAILIPVSIPATFTKAYIQFELTGEEVGYMNQVEMHLRAEGTTGTLTAYSTKTDSPDTPTTYTYSLDIRELTAAYVAYRYYQFEPFLLTREVIIKEIWFE